MRPLQALIDLDALRHNYQCLRARHGGRLLAVVKANAYGHGAVRCSRALAAVADGFAVACLEEAVQLRDAGIRQPILLLEGVFEACELDEVARLDLWQVVHDAGQLELLAHWRGTPLRVWLKLNSGMNRAGFSPDAVGVAWQRLTAHPALQIGALMTHFSCADEPERPETGRQLAQLDAMLSTLPGQASQLPLSLANSAALLTRPDSRRDWGRAGIALYGIDPTLPEQSALRPVMTLSTRIFAERTIARGETLGYGGRFVAPAPMRIGLIAAGYADGYPRAAVDGTPVVIDNQHARLVGRVSMDMITVDLSNLPGCGRGSDVELWGTRLNAETVARHAGTIAYEIFCNVKRATFRYRDSEGGDADGITA